MKINEYGNSTEIYFDNYDDIIIPGLHHFEIGSEFKLANGDAVIVRGYTHTRHQRQVAHYGKKRRLGWIVSEIMGISVVNPRGVSIGSLK